ncbi:hypothetical protein PLESTM_001861600 [Pleodorina starrii]|nr:hypothetical protein PLESTM_001861600 [Pleodorina starrii]
MHGMRDREQGSHDPPGGLTLVSGLTALFGAVVRSLDVPSEASWAQQSHTTSTSVSTPHPAPPPRPRRRCLPRCTSTAPPLGFTLRGVELRSCRARAPLSALAPQREHERATSQSATRLWRAPVSVLRSREPSRAVSPAVVHGHGTHVVHDSEENDGGSGSGHTIGSVGGGGGGACPPLHDPLMWSSTRRNDDGAPSGREKGRSKGGAVASLPAAAASGGGRASGGSNGHGVAVALVVAVDLAVCDAAASVAAQSSDDGLPSAQPPPARCNPAATTAAGGEAALAPPPLPPPPLLPTPPPLPRNGGPPGGGGGNALNDTASHYVSLPHSGPASRRMTVPGYTTQGPATAVKAPAEEISAKLTETSFCSTEGSEEDCVPHEDAGVCGTCSGGAALEPPHLGRQRTPSGVVTQRCCGGSGSTASVGRG